MIMSCFSLWEFGCDFIISGILEAIFLSFSKKRKDIKITNAFFMNDITKSLEASQSAFSNFP